MRLSAAMALALAVILAAPIVANADVDATRVHKYRFHAHRAYNAVQTEKIEPAASFLPHIAPYAQGQADTDGLSRNPDDCNKGCIGGNPG